MGNQLVMRPPVSSLTYQVFDRPFHPEFISSLETRCFERDGYRLRLHLTRSGHVIEWRWDKTHIVEVLCDSQDELPEIGQLFVHRVGGERAESLTPASTVSYQTCFQLEKIPAAVYPRIDGELRDDGRKNGVLHVLSPHDRLGLSPLSYVDLQARKNSLLIHTFHTFPYEYAVVKSQTLIEIK